MSLLSLADNANLLTACGDRYSVSLHGAAVATITGIFDAGGRVVGNQGSEVLTISPVLMVLESAAATLTRAHKITIGAINYQMIGPPVLDGQGLATLQLQEVR